MICRLLCSASVAGPTSSFGFGWLCFFFFSVHLGEIRPEQKNKLELAKNLMICRLLCSASGPTFGFGEKFCFCLTSKT